LGAGLKAGLPRFGKSRECGFSTCEKELDEDAAADFTVAEDVDSNGCSDCAEDKADDGCIDCAEDKVDDGCDASSSPDGSTDEEAATDCTVGNDVGRNRCNDCAEDEVDDGCSDCAEDEVDDGCIDCAEDEVDDSCDGCSSPDGSTDDKVDNDSTEDRVDDDDGFTSGAVPALDCSGVLEILKEPNDKFVKTGPGRA
jgi:hypothetical protein